MNPLRSIFVQISRIPPAMLLMFIVGLAVVVSMCVNDAMTKKERALQDQADKMKASLEAKATVVYAIKDVPEGETISSEALQERPIELARVPQDAIASSTLAAGRVAKYGISSGQIVSQHDLAPQAMQSGFESKLQSGMRAITFAVDNNSGVAGFVMPDSRVDIISMVGSGQETKAAPILSDVHVIAVGQTVQKAPNGTAIPASSITVSVTPEQGQKLVKAVCASKLYLSLRNDKDHTPLATVDVNSLFNKPQARVQSEMIGLVPPPQLPSPSEQTDNTQLPTPKDQALPPTAPQHEIESWSGGKKDVLTFAPAH